MGPSAREQPINNTESSPENMSQAEFGSLELNPLINSHADLTEPTARQQVQLAQIGDDITSSIKHWIIKPVKVKMGSGITQINKLSDTNWVNWHEDIIWMLNFL